MKHRGIWLLIVLVLMASCRSPENEAENERDSALPNYVIQTSNAATIMVETATAQASITPTLTPTVPTATIDPARIVTFTPRPTYEIRDREDVLGNTYPQMAWLDEPLTTTDGTNLRLQSFAGSVIVVRVVDTDCGEDCLALQTNLRALAEEYQVAEVTGVVFVTLNTNTTISPRSLLAWAANHASTPDTALNWYVGTITPRLYAEMEDMFGEALLQASNLPLIIVDGGGFSHVSQDRTYTRSELNSIINSYVFSEEEEDAGTAEPQDPENILPPTPTPTATDEILPGTPVAE